MYFSNRKITRTRLGRREYDLTDIKKHLLSDYSHSQVLIMEKDYRAPPSFPQMNQTGVNFPGQQAVYPPQAGQLIFHFTLTNKKEQDDYTAE